MSEARKSEMGETFDELVTALTDRILATAQDFGRFLGDAARYREACLPSDGAVEARASYPPAWLKQPRRANVFGLFGRRGSGKTTVLLDAVNSVVERPQRKAVGPSLGVLEPLDCSLCPPEVPLGLTVVHRLRAVLTAAAGKEQECRSGSQPAHKRASDAWDRLRDAYFRAGDAYHGVARQLAITPQHYSAEAQRHIEDRFSLPELLSTWLDAEAARAKVCVFLLPLDDVDLAPGPITPLLWSLLDELHQARLLLIVAADNDRLEQRIVKETKDHRNDLDSARDLLYKVIPRAHRLWLGPWTIDDRLAFRPLWDPKGQTVRHMIERRGPHRAFAANLLPLLPPFPRGLENLHRSLASEVKERDDTPRDPTDREGAIRARIAYSTADTTAEGEFLAHLAESRGEHELSRRLPGQRPDRWARRFTWDVETLGPVAWKELVGVAAEERAALDGIVPLPSLRLFLEDDSHDDAPHWAELLLDHALEQRSLQPWDLADRFRPVGERFEAAALQLDVHEKELQRFLLTPPASVGVDFLWAEWGDPGEQVRVTVGWQPLLRGLTSAREVWPSRLLDYLMVGRDQVRLAAGDPDDPASHPPESAVERDAALGIVPRSTRALILLADALAAAPWAALSRRTLLNSPADQTRLAAALVRAAYVQAIGVAIDAALRPPNADGRTAVAESDAGAREVDADLRALLRAAETAVRKLVAGPDNDFVAALRRPGTADLLTWNEEDLQKGFAALPALDHESLEFLGPFSAPRPAWSTTAQAACELLRAFRAYLDGPLFRALVTAPRD